MTLSFTAKESIKTALAMTIAYGIALSQDWGTPMWAGFAVIFVSLSTSGQSFNKSAMRMLGAFAAGAATLCLIALFPQDRWLFMLALSIYIGFCTYMMGTDKYQYFWFSAGYVCIIVALEAGPNPVNAFNLVVLRIQETGLGIVVYSIVTALLWRSNSVDKFREIVIQLQTTQHQLYRSYFSLMNGQGDFAEAKALMTQEIQQQAQFKVLLLAAETDSYEIWELRQQWQLYQAQVFELNISMEHWHDSYKALQTLDLLRVIPRLNAFDIELEHRFVEINRMLKGNAPVHYPQSIELQLDDNQLSKLSHFQKSALLATQTNLRQLERVTRALFNNLTDIKGYTTEGIAPVNEAQRSTAGFAFDIERLASILQAMASLWLSYLLFIYVYDLPGGIGTVIFSGVLGMLIAANSNMRTSSMVMPFMNSILICGILYTFVMPQLTSFIGLGTMIFLFTFVICYLYASPQKGMGRAAGLSMFVTMLGIENEQTYNILSVYNTALMFAVVFLVLFITEYMPFSPRPEQAFMRLLSRFFHSSECLMSTLSIDRQNHLSFWEQRRKDFHLHDIKTLPNKIETWSRFINTEVLLGTSKEHINVIISHLQVINIRLQALIEARANPQAQVLIDELLVDMRAWRISLQDTFQGLSKYPMVENQAEFYIKLTEITDSLESRIKTILNRIEDDQLSEIDKENFYRLLGAYRGVSDALLEYSGNASLIDWTEWREARF